MKRYSVELTGTSGILMHADNLEWVEMMQAWEKDPANQGGGIKGDDRSPAFRWLGCLYTDRGKVAIPADNLMTLLREGGARCPTGKGKSTFKSLSQSGLIVDQISWPLLVNGKEIPTAPLDRLREEADFKVHEEVCKSLGFELFVKRAKIGQSKHVRVRPRFENWSCSGTITVIEDQITESVLGNILTFAGRYSGLGDWRPSSPKSPGSWGKFTAVVEPFSGE